MTLVPLTSSRSRSMLTVFGVFTLRQWNRKRWSSTLALKAMVSKEITPICFLFGHFSNCPFFKAKCLMTSSLSHALANPCKGFGEASPSPTGAGGSAMNGQAETVDQCTGNPTNVTTCAKLFVYRNGWDNKAHLKDMSYQNMSVTTWFPTHRRPYGFRSFSSTKISFSLQRNVIFSHVDVKNRVLKISKTTSFFDISSCFFGDAALLFLLLRSASLLWRPCKVLREIGEVSMVPR